MNPSELPSGTLTTPNGLTVEVVSGDSVTYRYPDTYHPFYRDESVSISISDEVTREVLVFDHSVNEHYTVTEINSQVVELTYAGSDDVIRAVVDHVVLARELWSDLGCASVRSPSPD